MGKPARRSRRPVVPEDDHQHWDRMWLHETQRWLYSLEHPMDGGEPLPVPTGGDHAEIAAQLPQWCDFDGADLARFVQHCEALWTAAQEVRDVCASGDWTSAEPLVVTAGRTASAFGNTRLADVRAGEERFAPGVLDTAVRRIRAWAADAHLGADAVRELLGLAGVSIMLLDRSWLVADAAAVVLARANPASFSCGAQLADSSLDERQVLVVASGAGQRRLCKRHLFHDAVAFDRARWSATMDALEAHGWAAWPPPTTDLLADMSRSTLGEIAEAVGVSTSGNRKAIAGRIAKSVGGETQLDTRVRRDWQFEDSQYLLTVSINDLTEAGPEERRGVDELAEMINRAGSLSWYGPRQYVVGLDDKDLHRLRQSTRSELVEPLNAVLYPDLLWE